MVPTLRKVLTHLGNKLPPPASNHIGVLVLIHLADITMGIIISTTTITNIITTSIITTINIHMAKQLNIHLVLIMHINIQEGLLLFLLKLKLSLKNKNKFPLQV
jgi:hypothetical protein